MHRAGGEGRGWAPVAIVLTNALLLAACTTGFDKTDSGHLTATPCDPKVTDCTAPAATATAGGSKEAGAVMTPPMDGSVTLGKDASSSPAIDATATGECGSNPTRAACNGCCNSKHGAGADTYSKTFLNCACTTPGTCAQQCAQEACNGVEPTANGPCDTCLGVASSGSCGAMADSACSASADCVAWNACFVASNCDGKP